MSDRGKPGCGEEYVGVHDNDPGEQDATDDAVCSLCGILSSSGKPTSVVMGDVVARFELTAGRFSSTAIDATAQSRPVVDVNVRMERPRFSGVLESIAILAFIGISSSSSLDRAKYDLAPMLRLTLGLGIGVASGEAAGRASMMAASKAAVLR